MQNHHTPHSNKILRLKDIALLTYYVAVNDL